MIGRPGNPELANCELEAAFVNNEGRCSRALIAVRPIDTIY